MKGIALLETLSGAHARSGQQAWKQALVWEAGSARSAESLGRYLTRYPDAELQASSKKARAATEDLVTGEDLRQAYKALKAEDLATAESSLAQRSKRTLSKPAPTQELASFG